MSYLSFYRFLYENKTVIPDYQREYAQGRNNSRAKLIRESFVGELYQALVNKKEVTELDFVFGGIEGNHFALVDGQQRLTTLFLLHWYVLVRAAGKPCETVLQNFEYCTRDTTGFFCKHLNKTTIDDVDWNQKTISSSITDKQWFKGSMESDPTVKSMLVVLDCIHQTFNNVQDFSSLKDRLFCEDAPIKFHCLNMLETLGGNDAVQDLYIKMNARGVPLTGFEIVKAQLQKKKDGDRFDLLGKYLGGNDSPQSRTETIGRINTQYTNFFFELVDSGKLKKQGFDRAMMNFINEIVRINFFFAAIQCKVDQKTYRSDYEPIKRYSGKEFNEFIETAGKAFYGRYKIDDSMIDANKTKRDLMQESFERSIREFFALLDMLSSSDGYLFFANDNKLCCSNLSLLIRELKADPYEKNGLTLSDLIKRNALFGFILKYGKSITDAATQKNYLEWSRFVWKMVTNDDLMSFESVCENMTGLQKILKILPDQLEENSILRIISAIEPTDSIDDNFDNQTTKVKVGGFAKQQLEEEKIKAELRLKADANWNDYIVLAEDYVKDGQLWFLLKCSQTEDTFFDYDHFVKAFNLYKIIFDEDRKIKDSIGGYHLFERALLAIDLNKDHLRTMSAAAAGTKIFLQGSFKSALSHENDSDDAFKLVLSLIRNWIDNINICDSDSVKNALNDKIKVQDPIQYSWKYIMKRFDLLDQEIPGIRFQNGFEPEKHDGDLSFAAIYTSTNRRSDSGELFSFALAAQLKNAGENVVYKTAEFYVPYYEDDNQPTRYFTVGNKRVWFDPNNKEFVLRENDTESESLGGFAEAYTRLCGEKLPPQRL